VVEEVSPLVVSSLYKNRLHVGTLQRHIKKISAAWKRFMTKKVINLFQAAEISIVPESVVCSTKVPSSVLSREHHLKTSVPTTRPTVACVVNRWVERRKLKGGGG